MQTTTDPNNLTAPLAPGATGKAFVLAGKAIFTVSNPTGERYTFKVNAGKPRNGAVAYFGSFLTGPDNEADYTYLGLVNKDTLKLVPTTASPAFAADKHRPFRVLAWALSILASGKALPAGYEIRHAGRCGRCGRTLTVPESIELGLGPECAGKAGL